MVIDKLIDVEIFTLFELVQLHFKFKIQFFFKLHQLIFILFYQIFNLLIKNSLLIFE